MRLRANPTVVLWQNSCSGFQAALCQVTGAAMLCLTGFQCSCYQGTIQQLAWRWLNTTCFSKVSICGSFTWVHTRENPQPTPLHQEQASGSIHCSIFFPISTINKLLFGSGSKIAGGKQIFSTTCAPSVAHCSPAAPDGWHNRDTQLGWAWGQKAWSRLADAQTFPGLHHFQALIF